MYDFLYVFIYDQYGEVTADTCTCGSILQSVSLNHLSGLKRVVENQHIPQMEECSPN